MATDDVGETVGERNGKPKVKMTMKRLALLNGVANGLSTSEASRRAGYATPIVGHEMWRDIRKALPELMENAGITVQGILVRLRERLDATKTVTASFQGGITDSIEVADNDAQGHALDTCIDMLQLRPQ